MSHYVGTFLMSFISIHSFFHIVRLYLFLQTQVSEFLLQKLFWSYCSQITVLTITCFPYQDDSLPSFNCIFTLIRFTVSYCLADGISFSPFYPPTLDDLHNGIRWIADMHLTPCKSAGLSLPLET